MFVYMRAKSFPLSAWNNCAVNHNVMQLSNPINGKWVLFCYCYRYC